jgi:hypothetical protein
MSRVAKQSAIAREQGDSSMKAPDAIRYAKFFSRSNDAVIRVYNEVGAM